MSQTSILSTNSSFEGTNETNKPVNMIVHKALNMHVVIVTSRYNNELYNDVSKRFELCNSDFRKYAPTAKKIIQSNKNATITIPPPLLIPYMCPHSHKLYIHSGNNQDL